MGRFKSDELFELRNKIPVDGLIRDHLKIPSKISDGVFRFLCPVCHEFQTAVKPATNLARCFRCEKNFNTIDLIMEIKGYGFRDSVLYLKKIHTRPEAVAKLIAGIGRIVEQPSWND
jgi:DNA primase